MDKKCNEDTFFFIWRFFLDPIIVISLVTVRNCNIFFFIWKGLLRLVKQYMLKYQLWPMSSRWRRPGQSMAHKRNFLHKKVPLFGQCLLLYSESGWLNHWASTNCPKCINPVCWFSEHKTLPIPTPLTSCDCVGMCVWAFSSCSFFFPATMRLSAENSCQRHSGNNTSVAG